MKDQRLLLYAFFITGLIVMGCVGLFVAVDKSSDDISAFLQRSLGGRSEVPGVVVLGGAAWSVVSFFAAVLIHLIFAAAVFRDASSLEKTDNPPILVGPFVWALATLFGGVFVAAAYWVINRSSLRPDHPPTWTSQPPKAKGTAEEEEETPELGTLSPADLLRKQEEADRGGE